MPITHTRSRTGRGVVGLIRAPAARVRWLSATIAVWIARSQQRGALRELAERDDSDHLLRDAGITPEQARRAAAKWFWQP